jgi:hypothetical protein
VEGNMIRSGAKRVVVIKDIPSNVVEEAILVLKCDKDFEVSSNNSIIPHYMGKDFLIKEAESIIEGYISDLKNNETSKRQKNNQVKGKYLNFIINSCLVVSIIFFVYLILKIV